MKIEYRNQEITLTGLKKKVTIRELRPRDFMQLGKFPNINSFSVDDMDYAARMIAQAFVSGEDGIILTAKDAQDCTAQEYSILDLPQEDFNALSVAVAKLFSGGVAEAATFPNSK